MLPHANRLPISPPLKDAVVIKTPIYSIKWKKTEHLASRFGFVVSKRIDKRAVVRNRNKRLLRSVIESELSHFQPGYDILFILHKPIHEEEQFTILVKNSLKQLAII